MDDQEEELLPSKSALKRQMTALQKLGEELVGLSERELANMPLGEGRLKGAIIEAKNIKSNSARKRHFQFIGRLMRDIDAEPISLALNALHQQRRGDTSAFHELEQWRDRLITEGDAALNDFIQTYPAADRQHLRQLLRQQQKEAAANKPPAASRKIFKYLRELSEAS